MARWEKSPQWLIDLFNAQLTEVPGLMPRQMFGYPAGFVNGNMATGLFKEWIVVRLSEEDRAEALALEGAETFDPMGGRPMKEYVILPQSMNEDEEAVLGWVRRAARFTATKPPKGLKLKKPKPGASKAADAPKSAKPRRAAARSAKPTPKKSAKPSKIAAKSAARKPAKSPKRKPKR
jgi:TfoX/Sxy family transcriptional regulator of competence genes